MRHLLWGLVVTGVLSATAACTPAVVTTYPGPQRPKDEVALLKGYYRFYLFGDEHIEIVAVDGKGAADGMTGWPSVSLLPGHHLIRVRYASGVGLDNLYFKAELEADFATGGRYELYANALKDRTEHRKVLFWDTPVRGAEICIRQAGHEAPLVCRRAALGTWP